jgi:CTP synthase
MTKYIVILGGVISGIGKGITLSSIGYLLKKDYKLSVIKLDPYLNVDPGTMNPQEHGEVFVLKDGLECDMDFGHYQRYLNIDVDKTSSITSGKLYKELFEKERNGDYLGKTVQIIPHFTNLVNQKIIEKAKKEKTDIMLIELGGTVGDIEAEVFVESLRQLKKLVGEKNICYIYLTYLIKPPSLGEQKTKPIQQSIITLREKGIEADLLMIRSEDKIEKSKIEKLSNLSDFSKNEIFSLVDTNEVLKIPLELESQNFINIISKKLNLKSKITKTHLKKLDKKLNQKKKETFINILIYGKYNKLNDSYSSIIEAIKHSCYELNVNYKIHFPNQKNEIETKLKKEIDCIIVPGGFGKSGINQKIQIIKYARLNKIPFLGICLGLQLSVVEFLQNVCKLKDVSSVETNEKAKNKAIILMEDQKYLNSIGGNMRLGTFTAKLKNGIIKDLYKKNEVNEIHRHRYEVNSKYIKTLEKNGMKISGMNEKLGVVEFIELEKKLHPFFVATQSHPEFKSNLEKPNPLFLGLIKSCLK